MNDLNNDRRVKPTPESKPNRLSIEELRHRGHYTGEELLPFDGREGAMDAHYLPSRGIG